MITRAALAIGMAALVACTAATPVAFANAPSRLTWTPCEQLAPSWPSSGGDKAECTTVGVPVDHEKPDGRTIDLAVSRLPATDPAHRKGVLVLNPGGPGGMGVNMPQEIVGSSLRALNEDYDLIGFDPRGVGFSGQLSCPAASSIPRLPDSPTKEAFLDRLDKFGKAYADCAAADPEFFRTMTATSIAQDVDDIRLALGEQKISFYGISWGSGLGAAYRSLFDQHIDKMAIESLLPPRMDLSEMDAAQAAAVDEDAHRFTDWLAQHDEIVHFGHTGDEVFRALMALRDELTAHPRQVGSGDSAYPIDGDWVVSAMSLTEDQWTYEAEALAAVRDGKDPGPRPEATAARSAGLGYDEPRPAGFNRFAEHAINCNDTTGTRDLEQVWRDHEAIQARYPIGGRYQTYAGTCVHWPNAGKHTDYRPGDSTLQLVGHRHETVTPYPMALQLRQTIGGSMLTVDDDRHASLPSLPCADKLVRFFDNGVPTTDSCPGAPIPAPSPN